MPTKRFLRTSFKRVREFQMELEFGFWGALGKLESLEKKPLGARESTSNSKINLHAPKNALQLNRLLRHYVTMTTPMSIWQAHNNFSSLSDVSVVIVSFVFVNGDVVDVQNCQVLLLKISKAVKLPYSNYHRVHVIALTSQGLLLKDVFKYYCYWLFTLCKR